MEGVSRHIYMNSTVSQERPKSHSSGKLFPQRWVHASFVKLTPFEEKFEFVVHGFSKKKKKN